MMATAKKAKAAKKVKAKKVKTSKVKANKASKPDSSSRQRLRRPARRPAVRGQQESVSVCTGSASEIFFC